MLIDSRNKLQKNWQEVQKVPYKQVVTVGGIVISDQKVLALQRAPEEADSPDKWVLPGGKKDPFETTAEAVIREVKEETGLVTSLVAPIWIMHYQILKEDEVRDTTQINFLLAVPKSSKITLSTEHINYNWLTAMQAEASSLSKEVKQSIDMSFRFLAQTK
jgi:8-oxo-dGTP pyrophosphatase MutT (NUDIX family)